MHKHQKTNKLCHWHPYGTMSKFKKLKLFCPPFGKLIFIIFCDLFVICRLRFDILPLQFRVLACPGWLLFIFGLIAKQRYETECPVISLRETAVHVFFDAYHMLHIALAHGDHHNAAGFQLAYQ